MSNTRGTPGSKNPACTGKQSYLPLKSPIPTISPSYVHFTAHHCIGSIGIPRPREGNRHHQHTSSESFLFEEQPSWLDDLLNEPETPVRRGAHRRSSSDSFAYLDASNLSFKLDNLAHEGFSYRSITSQPSWGSEDFDHLNILQHHLSYSEASSFGRPQNRGKELALNTVNHLGSSHPLTKDKINHLGSTSTMREPDALTSTVTEKQDQDESTQDVRGSSDRREGSNAKQTQSEMETKRVKQQFAQRSRVRKLQYIAELERNVQALQAEGLEISAEIEFLDQQNLILSLENKALKQRLDSISQEHLLKCFEQEMFEREIARLRAFYHHQHQQQQRQRQHPISNHGRSNSRDLDLQMTNLSLKHKDASSGQDPVTDPLHI